MNERYVREIMYGFPYPIATKFTLLRTDECLDPDFPRLKAILATAEAITRFLGAVTLCECRHILENKDVKPSPGLAANFNNRFAKPTWGIWLEFLREGQRWLHQSKSTSVVPELFSFYFDSWRKRSQAAVALESLLTIRNEINHEKVKAMHRSDFKYLCERSYPLLEAVIESLDFLLDYRLKFASRIEVQKRRRYAAQFRHRFKLITGNSTDFSADRSTMNTFNDSFAILFENCNTGSILNLDPLYVDEESAGKAKDIFFYNGTRSQDIVVYAACNQGGSFQSFESERASEIAEELTLLKDIMIIGQSES